MAGLLVKNIGQLATPQGTHAKRGASQGSIEISANTCIAIEEGVFTYIGDEAGAPKGLEAFDAGGSLVTPGLVDSHTHLVFGGWRQHEMELKLKGVSYLDILKGGGGILSTVRETRKAGFDYLLSKSEQLAGAMLTHGTTTFEAKSGYGLNYDDEIKQLKVINTLKNEKAFDVVATFMGAHAVPEEYKGRNEDYINFLLAEVLPAVKEQALADYCDIFCETGVFDADLSRKYLQKVKEMGFGIKIHADEIDPIGGGELAGELAADSAEHLIAATDEGIKAMAKSGTIGVLLPATSFYLDKPYARARKMLEEGMAVAIASDFNPGSSPNFNMQLPMNLACLKYKLTPEETLTAATLNGAAAIGLADRVGSVEAGKQGDLVLWHAPDLNFLCYKYGNNLVKSVVKKGKVVA